MEERIMDFPRRQFLHLAAGAAVLPAFARTATAQAYPSKPLRIVVQVSGGSAPDIIARVIGQWLSERLGQPVVIDNRPGASGNIATEAVIRSPADGYTLLFCMSANSINASLFDNLRFSFMRDAAPVALIGKIPLVLEVHPSVPAKTVPEFIAYAKANPGKINIASSGNATPLHVAAELFKQTAGVDLVHVAYRGEPVARPDLLTGKVQAMFGVVPSSLPHIRSGKMRALAVSTEKRLDVLPDVPAMADFLPGFEASGWYGVAAPKDTPAEIVARLNKEIGAGLNDPKTKARLAELGTLVIAGSPGDMEKYVAGEIEKWGKVIKTAGIKPQ
jgi:tripartite-type tricarboxylate transporter receptor subunit TctC